MKWFFASLLCFLTVISSATLRVHVTLSQFMKPPSTQGVWLKLLTPGSSTVIWQGGPFTPNGDGIVTVTPSNSGAFDIEVKVTHWLNDTISGVQLLPSTVTNISSIFDDATNGDCDGDGEYIGTDDYLVLSNAFDASVGDPAFDPGADLNGDDYVGTDDYLILNANFDIEAPSARSLQTSGRHFWFTFPKSANRTATGKTLRLYFQGSQAGSGTLLENGVSLFPSNVLPYDADELVSFTIPKDGAIYRDLSVNDSTSTRSFLLSTTTPVSVQAVNSEAHNTEAFSVLPLQALGFDHVVTAYKGSSAGSAVYKSFITIVAPFGGGNVSSTSVTITPTVDCGSTGSGAPTRTAGEPFTVNLNSGQSYQILANNKAGDFTGTTVTSNHPVAVLSGSQRAEVDGSVGSDAAQNYLIEQAIPTDLWGDEYIVRPLTVGTGSSLRQRDSFVRVVAARNNTNVWVNGVLQTQLVDGQEVPRSLRRGEFLSFIVKASGSGGYLHIKSGIAGNISARKPVSVVQYSYSFTKFSESADLEPNPQMSTVPSISQLSPSLQFSVPNDLPEEGPITQQGHPQFPWHYFANLVVRSADLPYLRHNGLPVESSQFTDVVGSLYKVGYIKLTDLSNTEIAGGLNRVVSSNPLVDIKVGGIAYGQGYCDALGTLAAMTLVHNGGSASVPNVPTITAAYAVQPSGDSNDYHVVVNWTDNSSNEEGFYLQRRKSTELSFSWLATVPPNSTSYVDSTNLDQDSTYIYRICSFGDLSSAWHTSGGVITPPLPPDGLSITQRTQNSITLNWTDNSATEDNFIVERRGPLPTEDWTWVSVGSHSGTGTVSYTHTGLQPDSSYEYRVKSMRGNLHGLMLDWPVTGSTLKLPPLPPDPVTATAISDTEVRLTWTSGARAEKVEWQRSTVDSSSDQYWTLVTTVPTNYGEVVDDGLQFSTPYFYRARSQNNGGASAWRYTSSATTFVPPMPTSPTNVEANAISYDSADVSWSHSLVSTEGFEIAHSSTNGITWSPYVDIGKVLTYRVTGLESSTEYVFRVRTYNKNKTQLSAPVVSQPTTTYEEPALLGPVGPPVQVNAIACSTSGIAVFWTPVKSAIGYKLFRSNTLSNPQLITTVLPEVNNAQMQMYEDSGLTENQPYYYWVSALFATGESTLSDYSMHYPNADASPVLGSSYDLISWATSNYGDSSNGPVGPGNTFLLTPDDFLASDSYSGFQQNPSPAYVTSLPAALPLGESEPLTKPETREDSGQQFVGVSASGALRIKADVTLPKVSYTTQTQGAGAQLPIYDAQAPNRIAYQPQVVNGALAKFVPIMQGLNKEGINVYLGVRIYRQEPTDLTTEAGSTLEGGFQLNHYGDEVGSPPLRWTPFLRILSEPKYIGPTRYVKILGIRIPEKWFRADLVPFDKGYSGSIEYSYNPKSKMTRVDVRSDLGNTRGVFYGYAESFEPFAPELTASTRIRVKYAVGLDQVIPMPRPASWVPFPTTHAFKNGYMPSGSKLSIQFTSASLQVSPHIAGDDWAQTFWIKSWTPRASEETFGGLLLHTQNN